MIDPTRLRAILSDHPPQAFHQREQAAIRDVWEACKELLDARSGAACHLTREQLCALLDDAYLNGYHCGWSGDATNYVDDMLAEAGIVLAPARDAVSWQLRTDDGESWSEWSPIGKSAFDHHANSPMPGYEVRALAPVWPAMITGDTFYPTRITRANGEVVEERLPVAEWPAWARPDTNTSPATKE